MTAELQQQSNVEQLGADAGHNLLLLPP